jgi:hypothetical protein
MNEVVQVIDKAAAQSDRYLFIASLVLLLGLCGLVIRWLVNSLERKDAAHAIERATISATAAKERTEFAERIDRNQDSFEKKYEALRIENRSLREADKNEFLKALELLTHSVKEKKP